MNIPRVMSTQHPDNVNLPFFAETPDMSGDDEVQEAYYAFSHLTCDEQMWDCEGKEIDDFVVRKLLTRYGHFFKNKRVGRDVFLTLRLPNPAIEKDEAKVLLETLESIPRSMDASRLFYGDAQPPIFEVILPMTTSHEEMNRIYYYYRRFIIGKQHENIYEGDITVSEWIGEFLPESIQVIPLFEDMEHMLNAHDIVKRYLEDKEITYIRVFLARSDPAMNYGMISAILCNKISLQRLRRFSRSSGIQIYPVLGAGSPPMRGNLTPYTVEDVIVEYPEIHTFTVQSAFKYDNPVVDVVSAIKRLREFERKPFKDIDEERCLDVIERAKTGYQMELEPIAPLINEISVYIPRRRMRKLHVGLFGYSRSIGKIRLPRVISFCASCYSIGLPPEMLGFSLLRDDDISFLRDVYINIDSDLLRAMRYFNPSSLELMPDFVKSSLKRVMNIFNYEPDKDHLAVTSRIIDVLKSSGHRSLQDMIVEAGYIRRFLG